MTLDHVLSRLRLALAAPLPGHEAQLRMARRPRPGWLPGSSVPGCRRGAVLLLLYPKQGRPHVVFTLRSESLSHHRGQVSLPGGRVEEHESVVDAALREAREEIGVDPRRIHPLGEMTPFHLPVSAYVVHPLIGAASEPLSPRVASPEVERILEVPVDEILDPTRVHLELRALDGIETEIPYFDLSGQKVWGATAMILSEFLELLGIVTDPRPSLPSSP